MLNKTETILATPRIQGEALALKRAQDELKALKNRLNLSDEAMANAVGISLPRMVVMLYGEPEKIPGKIASKIKVLQALSKAREPREEEAATPVPRKRNKPELRPDQQELLSLQKELGLTHDDLARIAGIPRSRMMTYVYGRTRSIPEDVLVAIRKVRDEGHDNEQPFLTEAMRELEGSLPDFIARWQDKLGIDRDDHQTIAQAMGISKSTLLRWLDGHSGTRPSFVRKCLVSLREFESARQTAAR